VSHLQPATAQGGIPPSGRRLKHLPELQYELAQQSALTTQISPGPRHVAHWLFTHEPLQHGRLLFWLPHAAPPGLHAAHVSVFRSQPRLQHSLSKKHDAPFALHCNAHALESGEQYGAPEQPHALDDLHVFPAHESGPPPAVPPVPPAVPPLPPAVPPLPPAVPPTPHGAAPISA